MPNSENHPLQDVDIPAEVPAVVLSSTVVFPYDVVSVQVNKPKVVRLLDANPGDSVIVGCFYPKDPENEEATTKDDLLPVGVPVDWTGNVCR